MCNRQDIFDRWSKFNLNTCAYCGKPLDKRNKTLDHFYPKSKKGNDTEHNLIPCCYSCNQEKSNLHPWEWYVSRDFFNPERWHNIIIFLHTNHQSIINNQEAFGKHSVNWKPPCPWLSWFFDSLPTEQNIKLSALSLEPIPINNEYNS